MFNISVTSRLSGQRPNLWWPSWKWQPCWIFFTSHYIQYCSVYQNLPLYQVSCLLQESHNFSQFSLTKELLNMKKYLNFHNINKMLKYLYSPYFIKCISPIIHMEILMKILQIFTWHLFAWEFSAKTFCAKRCQVQNSIFSNENISLHTSTLQRK